MKCSLDIQKCLFVHRTNRNVHWTFKCPFVHWTNRNVQWTFKCPSDILQASEPFRFWAIDYMGLLPETNRCNKHILVLPNGIHEAFAAPNQKVSTVTKILVDGVLNRFRPPVVLHSDQGVNFEGTLIHKVCS